MAYEQIDMSRFDDDYSRGEGTTRTPEGDSERRAALKMSRAEAGRKGGLATKQRYGEGHFSRIGHKGGKKGGEATKRRYGVEFYKRIGRKGGSA